MALSLCFTLGSWQGQAEDGKAGAPIQKAQLICTVKQRQLSWAAGQRDRTCSLRGPPKGPPRCRWSSMGNRVTLLQLCKPWGHLVKNPNFREGMGCSLLPSQHSRGFILIYICSERWTQDCRPPSSKGALWTTRLRELPENRGDYLLAAWSPLPRMWLGYRMPLPPGGAARPLSSHPSQMLCVHSPLTPEGIE